jgi:hypothetical protein
MYSQALSVPEAIREVLANNNIYLQALEQGIANYTALAERIKSDVERLVGSKVNLNTIVVAVKRFADTLEDKHEIKPTKVTGKAKISLTGSIIDVNFQKEHDDDLADFLDEFLEQESRYDLFQTDSHLTLLSDNVDELRNIIASASKKFDGNMREDLSKITISLTPDEQSPYYILSLISNLLYNHQIPIYSAFFTPNEIVLILSEKHAAKAYDLIRVKIG